MAIALREEVIAAVPSKKIKIAKSICVKIIQDLLCPKILVRIGSENESISGAKKIFKVQGRLTSEKNPIVFKSKPLSTRSAFRVERIRAIGNPEEIPRKKIIARFLQDFCVFIVLDFRSSFLFNSEIQKNHNVRSPRFFKTLRHDNSFGA